MDAVPGDVARALQQSGLAGYFDTLARSHRNEYLRWIEEAKRPETRAGRIRKMQEMLASKAGD